MTETFLIVTVDDFGYSHAINHAVELAATHGIVTCASLMITGNAVNEALSIARNSPDIQTSLHLTLTETQPATSIAFNTLIVTKHRHFRLSPELVGLSLQFSKKIFYQVNTEVSAQFEAFARTGLCFDHVDCHHHLHIHPKLFDIVVKNALAYNIKSLRIPFEPWDISGHLCKGHTLRKFFYREVFTRLTSICRKKLSSTRLITTDGVFGLYRTGEITEQWLMALLDRLKGRGGVYELYTHPTTDPHSTGKRELDALISLKVKKKIKDNNIHLIRYRDIENRRKVQMS